MRIKGRVHYVSAKGSAEMVAESIAREMKIVKEPLLPAYMPENIALMFLGCEGTKADKVTMSFINSLNSSRVANAALFCCNGKKSDAADLQPERNARFAELQEMLYAGSKAGDKCFLSKHVDDDDRHYRHDRSGHEHVESISVGGDGGPHTDRDREFLVGT